MDDQQFNIDAIEIIIEYGLDPKIRKFCECVYNGKQAVDAVMQNVKNNRGKFCSYNLILIDCNMPFMDGYQATTLIREFLFGMSLEQPIITAITGHVEDHNVIKGFKSGMNLVASKPLKIEVIRELLIQTHYLEH